MYHSIFVEEKYVITKTKLIKSIILLKILKDFDVTKLYCDLEFKKNIGTLTEKSFVATVKLILRLTEDTGPVDFNRITP